MKCIGRTKKRERCKNNAKRLFCKQHRYQGWAASFFILTLLATLGGLFRDIIEPSLGLWSEPEFKLVSQFVRPDSVVIIQPQNRAAKRNRALDIELDGISFEEAGRPALCDGEQCWLFTLTSLGGVHQELISNGKHSIRLGFPGKDLSDPITVIFNSHAPIVEMEISVQDGQHLLRGRAASKTQHPADTISVEIVFHYEGYPQSIAIPVTRVVDEQGIIFYRFEAPIQDLPKYDNNDPRYSEPFFALRVTDQAGNSYYQQESYAQFIAPGTKRFGVGNLADIEVQQVGEDIDNQITVRFAFAPYVTSLPNGEPPIVLKVTSQARNVKQLKWSDLPDTLRSENPLTVILRDDRQIGISFGNRFTDQIAPSDEDPRYQVQERGRDGILYRSNVAMGSNTPPRIILLGMNPINIRRGEDYTEPGYGADDAEDGLLTDAVVVSVDGPVDISTADEYTLLYEVTDSGGLTTRVSRQVTITSTLTPNFDLRAGSNTAPSISLKGGDITLDECNEKYQEPGFVAVDPEDGEDVIVTKNAFAANGEQIPLFEGQTPPVGTYVISYRVTDKTGSFARVTRDVTVTEGVNNCN